MGVATVREIICILIDSEANRAIIVTTGEYTSGAKEFANGKPIELINSGKLRKMLSENLYLELI